MIADKDDPNRIASHLIDQQGVDGAWDTVREGIAIAHENEDNYVLSVWREVRRALDNKQDGADNTEISTD
jgi:hypothetical protein